MSASPKNLLGKRVEILSLKRRGLVSEGPNKKGEYRIELGAVSLWVAADNLKPEVASTSKRRRENRARVALPSRGGSMKIDLHGMTRTEALDALERVLDRALLADCSSIEIIHGIGSGVLKAAVVDYCRASTHVAKLIEAPNNPGTSIAYLR